MMHPFIKGFIATMIIMLPVFMFGRVTFDAIAYTVYGLTWYGTGQAFTFATMASVFGGVMAWVESMGE